MSSKNMARARKELSKQLHGWYLEATKELDPKSFNAKAQKPYEDLTSEQKFIDIYIADRILEKYQKRGVQK